MMSGRVTSAMTRNLPPHRIRNGRITEYQEFGDTAAFRDVFEGKWRVAVEDLARIPIRVTSAPVSIQRDVRFVVYVGTTVASTCDRGINHAPR